MDLSANSVIRFIVFERCPKEYLRFLILVLKVFQLFCLAVGDEKDQEALGLQLQVTLLIRLC